MDYYKTLAREGFAEFKEKGSRFLAFANPVGNPDEFKAILTQLKQAHPKAVHHCFAYRLGVDGQQYRANDDGEPSGSAARPILGQIDSKGLTNTAIVVVRYFGGTLLGVPGLIYAYKTAASLVLQVTPIVEKAIEVTLSIHCSYPLLNDVVTLLKQSNAIIISNQQSLFCDLKAAVAKNRLAQVAIKLNHLYGVEWHQME